MQTHITGELDICVNWSSSWLKNTGNIQSQHIDQSHFIIRIFIHIKYVNKGSSVNESDRRHLCIQESY
jgi:hypothetical protein